MRLLGAPYALIFFGIGLYLNNCIFGKYVFPIYFLFIYKN